MSNNPKKVIIWIEDKAEKNLQNKLQKWCKYHEFELLKQTDLSDLAVQLQIIQEEKTNKTIIKGFIVDLLLSGTNDLSSFGVDNIEWNHLQTDGGLMLIQHVLRSFPEYETIPILVLSVRATKILELDHFKFLDRIKKRDFLNEEEWEKDIQCWIENCNCN